MRERIKTKWQEIKLKRKIEFFTAVILVIVAISVVFNIWLLKFSLTDLSSILDETARSNRLVESFESEIRLFTSYVKNENEEDRTKLEAACTKTGREIENLPLDYRLMHEYRYSKIWSIKNSYHEYEKKRDVFLRRGEAGSEYVKHLYELYEMQEFIKGYTKSLQQATIDEGVDAYEKRMQTLNRVPSIVAICGILLIWGVWKFSDIMKQTVIVPVAKLEESSKRISANDFFVPDMQVDNKDELGELVIAFNKMKRVIGSYINELEKKQETIDALHKKEVNRLVLEKQLEMTKFELLKNQIKPHFLFNTLNVISGMANLEEAETTKQMIEALSTLFRYNLKTNTPEVALYHEIYVIKRYMYLQQMRFGDRLTYQLDCQVDAEQTFIPSFTLQPLVENAIIHGISRKEEGGMVKVVIRRKNERLEILVADNGSGMDKDQLKLLRRGMTDERGELLGIGLGSVYKRIYSMYRQSRIKIYSRKGKGTVVRIEIVL